MTFTTTQKLIKIGTSRGVTLPARELKRLKINDSDEIEITVRKKKNLTTDEEVIAAANLILEKYSQAFDNLSKR